MPGKRVADMTPEELEHRRARGREHKRDLARKRRALLTDGERDRLREASREYERKHKLARNKKALAFYREHRDAGRARMRAWRAAMPEERKRAYIARIIMLAKLRGNGAAIHRNKRIAAMFSASVRLMSLG